MIPPPFKCGPTKKRGGKRRKNKRTGEIGVVSLYVSCPKLLLSAAGLVGWGRVFLSTVGSRLHRRSTALPGPVCANASRFWGLEMKKKKCLYYAYTLKNIETLNEKRLRVQFISVVPIVVFDSALTT